PMPVGMMAKMALGGMLGDNMLTNVNTKGSMAVFAVWNEDAPAIGIIMPTETFKKFISDNANASEPDAQGISTIKGQFALMPGMEMEIITYASALPKKGFMLLSPESDMLLTVKKAMTSTAIATALDSSDITLAETKPLWARVNIAKLSELFGPILEAQLNMARQQITADMEKASDGNKPPMEMAKIMGLYFDAFEKILADSDYLSLSLDPTAEVLNINYTYGAKKGSDVAGLLVDSNTPVGPFKTAGYLDSSEAINMLIKVDKKISAKTNAKMLDLISAITEDMPQENIVKWKTLLVDSVEAMGDEQAFSFSLAKGSPPLRMKQVIMLDDPAKYKAVTEESFAMVNDFYKALGLPVTIDQTTAKTETYKGATIETIKINIDADALVGGDPKAKELIDYMYENMGFKSAITNNYFVMAMGDNADADIKKLIDKTGAGTSAPTGDIATAMKLLKNSDKAEFIVTVNYLRLLAGIGEMMEDAPMPEAKMAAGMFSGFNIDSKSCLVMAGNVGDGKVSVDIAFPKQHLMEMMAAVMQMQQQQMQKMNESNQ
ncbi:MAG: hypothetical protein KAS23_16605, partial [Anaerohalosphaera sp.]|nr:hypothetical protein [Anaerohalosphaera sp.]